jgi:signal transduction histidine kinase
LRFYTMTCLVTTCQHWLERPIQAKLVKFCGGLLLVGSLLSGRVVAQSPQIDSLKALLTAHPQADTGRVNRLNALSQAVRNSDPALQLQMAQEALTLARRLKFGAGQAQAYLHLSQYAMTASQYKQAASYAQQARQLYRRLGDGLGQVNCLNRLSSIATDQGDYAQSIAYIQQSLVLVEPIPDKSLKGYINFLLAQNYTMLADYAKARSYATAGLQLAQEANDLNERCRGLSILGIINYKQGNLVAARRYYEQTLPLLDKLGRPLDRASTEGNIAGVCVYTGQYTDAFRYSRRALAYVRSINATSYLPWIEEILAEAHLRTGRVDSAIVYASQSLRAADAGGMRDESMNAAEVLAEAYARQGNYAAAFKYQSRYMSLKDSLRGEETIRQTASLQYKFDLDKKQSQIALLTKNQQIEQERSQYQRRLLYASGVGALLLVALAVMLFRNVRVKQRVNELLSQQKELMENQLTEEIFMQRQQLLETQLKAQQEELRATQSQLRLQQEKERIARDLHDHVGAQLSVIASSLDHVRMNGQLNGSATHLEAIGNHARDAIGSLRETIWAINREHIPLGEFAIQLQQYLNRQRQLLPDGQVSLRTHFTDATQVLSSEQALNLFRIAQEAVGNAMRHARADTIQVTISTDDTNTLQLVVMDDGAGFDVSAEHPGHYGLLNMQLRAERLGSKWDIISETGRGTTLSLVMPRQPILVTTTV